MADDKSTPEPDESNKSAEPDESNASDASTSSAGEASPSEDAEELSAAEGPDVETSFTDADLSFLEDVSQGAAEPAAPATDIPAGELLVDLQRVTAEYANYRKRTEANREVERERSVGDVVKVLLPVLDDLNRAEKHGDLEEGPFVTIAQKLRSGVERLGLKPFGAVGDAFDPQLHEAIFQQPTPGATAETVADVVETGYYLGGTLLRAAKVVVAVPGA